MHFDLPSDIQPDALRARLDTLSAEFGMDLQLHDARRKARLLIMVSKQGHCLNDLLFRVHSGQLRAEVAAIVSNHNDYAPLAATYGIPFHHLPVTPDTKAQQEQQVLDLAAREHIDLVVLARYMQILSADMPRAERPRHQHPPQLPAQLQGARPYHQAHARGVKIIGATAHYVTSDLDEGPIIDQDIERVDHTMTAADLTQVGSDIESLVLSRAVRSRRTPHPAEPQQDRRLPLIAGSGRPIGRQRLPARFRPQRRHARHHQPHRAFLQRRAAPAGQIAWLTERASCSKPMKRVPASLRDRQPARSPPQSPATPARPRSASDAPRAAPAA